MAVVAVRSTLITNIMASPMVQNTVTVSGGRERSFVGVVTVTNGDSIGSVFRLMRCGSHWRCKSLLLRCAAVTGASIKLGYLLNEDVSGAGVATVVVASSDAVYAASQSIATAIAATPTDLAFGTKAVSASANLVWADAGLSAAPAPTAMYDLAFTLTAAATATGAVAIEATYVID
jgi:hypothetical protein